MKMINNKTFGKLTYNYQWERPIDVSLWGHGITLLLAVESETDDDDSISEIQVDAFRAFESQHASLENQILNQLQQYCREEFGVSDNSTSDFLAHNTPTSVYFPLSGEWAILFDSEYDEEGGLAAVVRNGEIEIGSQDIIL